MQVRYLVRKTDGSVFIWTETLAKRKDLEEVWADNPKDALEKDTMPDPARVSLSDLENMTKIDLMIFAKVKLGLEIAPDMKHADMMDEVKLAIFRRPTKIEQEAQAEAMAARKETTPMSNAAAARGRVGV